jgi:EAL and modified HD-GYP domain-containing signal transduction protein
MDVFVAKQPIFDRKQEVFAYELLFRSGFDNFFSHPDQDQAASKLIADSSFLFGVESITGGKKAFINVTRDVLVKEYITILPKDLTVVEILETVEPDEAVIAACKKLKFSGYPLALDDFVYEERFRPLIELADIIKVDFLTTSREERGALVKKFAPLGIRFLAERVETREEFDLAMSMGYTYFQGYFFSKPVILAGKDIPGFKVTYLRILKEVNRAELNLDQIENTVKQDVALSYKLLRYINSPFFGWRKEVGSIKHALALLGDTNVKKWVSLVCLASMGEDKPAELVVTSITRAKFCEYLAAQVHMKNREQDLFLMGMFSLMDAIVDRPMSEILEEMPISQDIKVALSGGANLFREIYEYVLAYEKGDWDQVSEWSAKLRLKEPEIPELYFKSVAWARQIFQL